MVDILISTGIVLILLGFLLVMTGILRAFHHGIAEPEKENRDERVKGGGVILIGPIPIVFGSDRRYASIAMVLAIILMIVALIFFKL